MFARNALVKILPRVRQMSTISGPPSNPLSMPEKMAHGAVIAFAILGIPTWVLTHLSEYRGGSE